MVEVYCKIDRPTMESRYRARATTRVAGHFDAVRTAAELWGDDTAGPVGGDWPLIEVNTTGPVDVVALARAVTAAIRAGAGDR